MNKFTLLLALLLVCPLSFAQDTTPDTAVTASAPAKAIGKRYIRDSVMVPLRSGHSAAYRVIHSGIPSGTLVDLLVQDTDSGYSLVRLSTGKEGWLPSQYLQTQKTAAMELSEAQALIHQLTSDKGSSGAKLMALTEETQDLKEQLKQTQTALEKSETELEHIKAISANAVNLDQDNRRLLKTNEDIKNHRDMLKAENSRLKDALKRDDFINGVIAVILGMIATLVIQYFYRTRKRSEWA